MKFESVYYSWNHFRGAFHPKETEERGNPIILMRLDLYIEDFPRRL